MNKTLIKICIVGLVGGLLFTACSKENNQEQNKAEQTSTDVNQQELQTLQPVSADQSNMLTEDNSQNHNEQNGSQTMPAESPRPAVAMHTSRSDSTRDDHRVAEKETKQNTSTTSETLSGDEIAPTKTSSNTNGNAEVATKKSTSKATQDDAVAAAMKAAEPALNN